MGTFIQYLSLFFCIVFAEVLHISVFRYGHLIVALLLFFVFFLRPKTALICAFFAGILEDIIVGPFGFHMIVYPLITISSSAVCGILLTNKSFLAFFLLEIVGFFVYHGVGGIFISFQYVEEILYGFFIQSIFIFLLFAFQYRRIRSSRAYLMFSE